MCVELAIMQRNDAEQAAAMNARASDFPWQVSAFQDSIRADNHFCWWFHHNNHLVGAIIFSLVADEADLLNIFIDGDCQQKGYGQRLLSTGIENLLMQGMRSCTLEVRRSNRAAIALYQSMKFNECGVRKNYYPAAGEREDAIVMRRDFKEITCE